MYYTAEHQSPPSHIPQNGQLVPVRKLIKREDTTRLAELGIYPHITAPGEAPLGYTDWVFDGTQYSREPAGTQAERDAAAHESYLDSLSCTRLQGRLELIAQGLWLAVQEWAASAGEAEIAYFEDAQTWRFRDATLQAAATGMPLTEAQVIGMFESAQQR